MSSHHILKYNKYYRICFVKFRRKNKQKLLRKKYYELKIK